MSLLDDEITGFGIRSRRRGHPRAADPARALSAGRRRQAARSLLDATAGSDAGIDVVGSEYATIAAEQTALESLPRRSPTRSSPGSRSMRSAQPAARDGEGEAARRSRGRCRRPAESASSCSTAPTRPVARAGQLLAAALGPGGGADRADRRRAQGRSGPARRRGRLDLAVRRRALYLVEPAGDESVAAVEALLEAPAAGNPVPLVAGALQADLEAAQARARPSPRRWPSPAMRRKAGRPSGWCSTWRASGG